MGVEHYYEMIYMHYAVCKCQFQVKRDDIFASYYSIYIGFKVTRVFFSVGGIYKEQNYCILCFIYHVMFHFDMNVIHG